ncbi:hypothetical protein [Dactylococcopsis salina]|uniref:hypothetical protein n=1 Tax=Dactylococcopsis salina TaxID=292566 RepID=UPI0002E9BB1B|nr:hypothetical protein [Dactylococcopsis salina]
MEFTKPNTEVGWVEFTKPNTNIRYSLFVIRYSLFVICSLITGHWSPVTDH